MAIKIYSSLTQEKTPLISIKPNEIKMYVCGPTVYDDCHIGHLMGPVIFDSIARWLKQRNYEVSFVNNITDIDDKIIQRSIQSNEPWESITKRYTQQYWDFLTELNVNTITSFPKCTEFIPQMIAYIESLIQKDRAYVVNDGVYYEISKQKNYGKLTRRNTQDMQAGARIEAGSELKNPLDFCLWKSAKPGEPSWDSPWGKGRPGWHLECSVMSNSILGDTFDIHGGGDDLKFPHHENEIAQGEAFGGEYAHYWMHNGLIQYEGVKIGKSDPRMKDPNFAGQFKARFLMDTYGGPTIRFFLLQGHYRRPNDFAPKNLENAKISLNKIYQFLGDLTQSDDLLNYEQIKEIPQNEDIKKYIEKFGEAMDDDFNSGYAIGQIFSIAKDAKKLQESEKKNAQLAVLFLGRTLGLFLKGDQEQVNKEEEITINESQLKAVQDILASHSASEIPNDFENSMKEILSLRQKFRQAKDYQAADKLRDQLQKIKIVIKDSPQGPIWELTK